MLLFSQTSIFLRDALYSCRVTAGIAVRHYIMIRLYLRSLYRSLSLSVLLQEEVGLDEYMINTDCTDNLSLKTQIRLFSNKDKENVQKLFATLN